MMPGGFVGFKTAKGDTVTVSEESLRKVKSLWDDEFSDLCDGVQSISEVVLGPVCNNNNNISPDVGDNGVTEKSEYLSVSISSEEVNEISKALLEDDETGDSFGEEVIVPGNVVNEDEELVDQAAEVTLDESGPSTFEEIRNDSLRTIDLIHVIVARVYPFVVGHKNLEGKFDFYSLTGYEKIQRNNEAKRLNAREKLYQEVEAEFAKSKPKIPRKSLRPSEVEHLEVEELLSVVENSDADDILEISGILSENKLGKLKEARRKSVEDHKNKIQAEVDDRMKLLFDIEEDNSCLPVFRVRLLDATAIKQSNRLVPSNFFNMEMSFWNPSEDICQSVIEGGAFEISSVRSSYSQQQLCLYSTRSTTINPLQLVPEIPEELKRQCSLFDDILDEDFNPPFGEFDTVGLVVQIDDPVPTKGQLVYLSDQDENIISLRFWKPIVDEGVGHLIQVSKFVSCLNLQWRESNHGAKIPAGHVKDTTSFSSRPSESWMKEHFKKLKDNIEDVRAHILTSETRIQEILECKVPKVKSPTFKRRMIQPLENPGSVKKRLVDNF